MRFAALVGRRTDLLLRRRRPNAEGMSEGRIVVVRCVLFRAGRRFSGSLVRKTVRRMTGKTGAVVDLRNPPMFARGVHLDHQAWPVRWVTIDGHVSREVGSRTVQPFGVELEPGHHLLTLLDRSHHLVKSAQVEVRQGALTLVTVFPPTTFLVPSKRVRAMATIDQRIVPL